MLHHTVRSFNINQYPINHHSTHLTDRLSRSRSARSNIHRHEILCNGFIIQILPEKNMCARAMTYRSHSAKHYLDLANHKSQESNICPEKSTRYRSINEELIRKIIHQPSPPPIIILPTILGAHAVACGITPSNRITSSASLSPATFVVSAVWGSSRGKRRDEDTAHSPRDRKGGR